MAGKKSVSVGLNMGLLAGIAAGTVTHISKADGVPLLTHDPALIDVNTEMLDPADNAAVRLTDAGKAMVAEAGKPAAAPTNGASQSKYAVISNAVLPASKRRGGGGGAPTVYPFDSMEIGQSFFVPVSEKHKDPVKTLGSTVSSANMRFAVDTGEKKEVERTKRGPKNKAVLDADGNKIREKVMVPVYKHTRKFSIRPVKSGVNYGGWVAPADGALIARVELKSE